MFMKIWIPVDIAIKLLAELMIIANIALTPTWQIDMKELAAPIFEAGIVDRAFSCINGRKKDPAILWRIMGNNRAILKLKLVLSQAINANITVKERDWKQKILL